MWKTIERTIEEYQMLKEGDKVIVGVSGGADSVCLLRVLHGLREKWKLSLTVVHIEHGIRGKESLQDAAFVEKLCEDLDVPYQILHYDVPALASQWGMTVEEAGRKVRYDSFTRFANEAGSDRIAVAHNANDAAETVLFHLVRGTGIQGLAGIPPVRDRIIRPLIQIGRSQIEAYLHDIGQEYCVDETNLETEYSRNKIRQQVLPILTQINPEAITHIVQAAGRVRDVSQLMQIDLERLETQYCRQENGEWILTQELMRNEVPVRQEWIIKRVIGLAAGSEKDITASHVNQVRLLMENQTGRKCDLPYGLEAIREYAGIHIRRKNETHDTKQIIEPVKLQIPGDTVIERMETVISTQVLTHMQTHDIPEKKYTKWFDYDIIGDSLQVRTRQSGDYFVVNSQGGHKKLKDYFIEEKVLREERDQVLLLACGHEIIWIIGMRMGEFAKVTANTRKILEIQINGGQGNERNN